MRGGPDGVKKNMNPDVVAFEHFKTWENFNHTAPNFSEMNPLESYVYEIPSHIFIWNLQECKYVEKVEV